MGASNATSGNVTAALAFAGSCLAQITGKYQEIGRTASGQLAATPRAATMCPVFNFLVAVSSRKPYCSFSVAGTNNQFREEGFQ